LGYNKIGTISGLLFSQKNANTWVGLHFGTIFRVRLPPKHLVALTSTKVETYCPNVPTSSHPSFTLNTCAQLKTFGPFSEKKLYQSVGVYVCKQWSNLRI
jgi:hypothetical protein